jgi:glycosyltransferase involved in cell wall biosynthesis
MRILIVCPDAPHPPRDGGALRIINLALSLSRYAEVNLLTYSASDREAYLLDQWGMRSQVRVYSVQRPARRNRLTRAWHKLAWDYAWYLFGDVPGAARFNARPVFAAALDRVLLHEQPDVIIWEYWHMASFVERARRIAPQAIQMLDQIDVEGRRLQRQMQIAHGVRSRWAKWIAPRVRDYELDRQRRVDAVITISAGDADFVQRRAPRLERPHVLSMGLMLDAYPQLDSGDSKRVLFFYGSLQHAPNADALHFLMHDIYPLLRRRHPEVTLDVMGAHAPASVARSAGVRAIDFQTDMKPFLNDAAVVLAPLRFGAGLKIKVLEAMAYGKTVVTTPVGAEDIDACGGDDLIVTYGAQAMVEETVRLLKNPAARVKMGRCARACIRRRYDAYAIAHDFVETLRRWRDEHRAEMASEPRLELSPGV